MTTGRKFTTALTLALAAMAGVALTTTPVLAVPWTPAEITTTLWLDASDAATIHTDDAAGRVSQWDDKSGNANNVASAAAIQPNTGTRTLNGLNAIDFVAATQHRLQHDTLTVAQPHTVFAVLQNDLTSGWRPWWSGGSGGGRTIVSIRGAGAYERSMWANGGFNGTPGTTNPEVWSAEFNGASSKIYVNGSVDGSGTVGANTINGLWIGEEYNTVNHFHWDGLIAEIVLLDSVPSQDTREKMEGYLAHKWGQEGSLPLQRDDDGKHGLGCGRLHRQCAEHRRGRQRLHPGRQLRCAEQCDQRRCFPCIEVQCVHENSQPVGRSSMC